VAFVTGHEDPEKEDSALDYEALAKFPGTLVFYMGVKALPRIADALIAGGRDASEPAAVVERGTLPGQRTVSSTLEGIAAAAEEAGIRPPSVTIVGPVAARRERIAWLERRPLHGKKVIVTRARAQASELSRQLDALGAEAVELPAIRIEPRIDSTEVREAIESLHTYALVCITSPNGAHLLFEAMATQGRDSRALANASVAAIGSGTEAALAAGGILADIVPERFVAEQLVEELEKLQLNGKPVLIARAAEARELLPEALRKRGAQVDEVALYETVAEKPDPEELERARDADFITFTSSSTVRNFMAARPNGIPESARIISIGPITSEAIREAGLTVDVEAERHDIAGLVAALLDAAVSVS
jgi:uroporphyrinogen III methyltransferase/synthase